MCYPFGKTWKQLGHIKPLEKLDVAYSCLQNLTTFALEISDI